LQQAKFKPKTRKGKRMSFKRITLALLILTIAKLNLAEPKKITVLPTPQSVVFTGTTFALPRETTVFIDKRENEYEYCRKAFERIGKESKVVFKFVNTANKAVIKASLVQDLDLGLTDAEILKDAYRLSIDNDGIDINAVTCRGLFYGIQTLSQIIAQSENGELPGIKIKDWPDFRMRGISDDISRGQVSTVRNFKKIIDFLARYKMNVYMPYLEDMLRFDEFPSIGKGRGALTKEEVKEIVRYASERFVQVIPIFQTLGHYENILAQPQFLKYAEFPGAASLNISSDSTYIFLDKLLKEATALFPSVYFHMGADESFDVGYGKSKKMVDSLGIAAAHAEHYKKVYNILKKYGKKVMMYGDIILRHPEILDLIPKDIIIVDWHYRADYDYPSLVKFHKAGFKTIASPSVWNFLTTYPTNLNALPNIEYFAKDGFKEKAIGLITSNWGDYGAETFKELLYWGYAWTGECAWNIQKADIAKFNSRFFKTFFGTNDDTPLRLNITLSNPLNQFLWHEIWRHPLLPFKKAAWWTPNVSAAARLTWLKQTLPLIRNDVEKIRANAKRNTKQTEIYKFLLDLYSWYSLKTETQLALLDTTTSISEKRANVIPLIDENISRLSKLKKEFKKIWLQYYKPDNLNLIEDKFNRLNAYFKETKEELQHDTLYSPVLKSKWIYAQVEKDSLLPRAKFRYLFLVSNKKISSAKLQLMGNTYAELYINGKFVTKVYARLTLSLSVEYGRVKYLDIKNYLRKGENEIVIKAASYGRKPKAGANIIAEITYTDGEVQKIETDENWQSGKWESNKYEAKTVSKDFWQTIIAPNFKTNRPSWIER